MEAEIAKEDFQWFLNWLSDQNFQVVGISMSTADKYNQQNRSYTIEYEPRPQTTATKQEAPAD